MRPSATTKASHYMTDIQQLIPSHVAWLTASIVDIEHPSIDCCQNRVSADQYHMTISWTKVSHVPFTLTADQVTVFALDRRLMPG